MSNLKVIDAIGIVFIFILLFCEFILLAQFGGSR